VISYPEPEHRGKKSLFGETHALPRAAATALIKVKMIFQRSISAE